MDKRKQEKIESENISFSENRKKINEFNKNIDSTYIKLNNLIRKLKLIQNKDHFGKLDKEFKEIKDEVLVIEKPISEIIKKIKAYKLDKDIYKINIGYTEQYDSISGSNFLLEREFEKLRSHIREVEKEIQSEKNYISSDDMLKATLNMLNATQIMKWVTIVLFVFTVSTFLYGCLNENNLLIKQEIANMNSLKIEIVQNIKIINYYLFDKDFQNVNQKFIMPSFTNLNFKNAIINENLKNQNLKKLLIYRNSDIEQHNYALSVKSNPTYVLYLNFTNQDLQEVSAKDYEGFATSFKDFKNNLCKDLKMIDIYIECLNRTHNINECVEEPNNTTWDNDSKVINYKCFDDYDPMKLNPM